MKKKLSAILGCVLASGMIFAGCADSSESGSAAGSRPENSAALELQEEESSMDEAGDIPVQRVSALTVRFGQEGEPFTLHLYENDTAAAVAGHVGTSDWNLPIYHYDDYDNWEVMQYYDIPSHYEIPSEPEEVTEEKAGEVYYSEPNRIILFYKDAEVPAEYTPVGYFDHTSEFVEAVENNPVLEGWGNKIISVSAGE